MSRGLWREWEERNGAETWSARVELRSGQWTSVEASQYERAGYQPPFWALPLKEEYLEETLTGPIREEDGHSGKWMQSVIIAFIALGSAWFLFGLVANVLYALMH